MINKSSLLILLIVTILLTMSQSTHSLLITPTTLSCDDISTGYCEIRFALNANATYTIAAAAPWFSSTHNVKSLVGTCTLTASGLQLTPPPVQQTSLDYNVVRCGFDVRSGSVLPTIPLGSEHDQQILPALAFSNFDINFSPVTPLEATFCQNAKVTSPCNGIFKSGSDTFPFTITTTSTLALTSCHINGVAFDNVRINLESTLNAANKYSLSLTTLPSVPSQISCTMVADKLSYGPYFHISKNNVVIYKNYDIQLTTIDVVKLPLCAQPTSPICPLAFYIDEIIDTTGLSIQPMSYLYQLLEPVSQQRCALLNQSVIPPRPGKRIYCGIFRQTLHSPTTFLSTTVNPFVMTGKTDFPVVTFALGGKFFNGQKISFDFSANPPTIYTNPLIMTQTQAEINQCNDSSRPVCITSIFSYYQGPPLTSLLTAAPLAGADFTYCFADSDGSKSKMSVTIDHRVSISDQGKLATLADSTKPWSCIIGYYKYHTSANQSLPEPIGMQYYNEILGGNRVTFRSFLPQSNLGQLAITNTLFNNVPLKYNYGSDCEFIEAQDCTVEIYVEYDPTNPTNFMRSFDIFLPFVDSEFAYIHGRSKISTAGFSSSEIKVTTLLSEDTQLDEVPFKFYPPETGNVWTKAGLQSAYFRVEVSHSNIGEHVGMGTMSQIYSSNNLRHSIFITYPKILDCTGSNLHPTLLRYNNQEYPVSVSSQPAGLLTTGEVAFTPSIAFSGTDACRDPTNAYCFFVIRRAELGQNYIYLRPLHKSLNGIFGNINMDAPKLFQTPEGEVLIQINLGEIWGAGWDQKKIHTFPLTKPYGLNTNPNIGVATLLEDANFEPVTTPAPAGSLHPYPVVQVLHDYQYQVGFAYNNDLIPIFSEDCSAHAASTCTITYHSTSPVVLAGRDVTLIRHKIPTLVKTEPITATMSYAEIAAAIPKRLAKDWFPQAGIVKEARTPIALFNAGQAMTANFLAYLEDQVNLIPNSSPLALTKYVMSGGQIPLELPPTVGASTVLPAHREGDVFFRVDLDTDASTGDSYVSVVAFVKPYLVAWRAARDDTEALDPETGMVRCTYIPTDPLGECRLDQLRSVLTGVFTGFTNQNGALKGNNSFHLTLQLGLWAARQSSKLYTRPSIIHGSQVDRPEELTPFAFPPTGYYPVEIAPMDDCMNSYKTGLQSCTFSALVHGTTLRPLANFTFFSQMQIPNNWMISNSTHFIYTQPVNPKDDIDGTYADFRAGILTVNRITNLVILKLDPQFQTIESRLFLTFIDEHQHPSGKPLIALAPYLSPPTWVGTYVNVDFDEKSMPAPLGGIISNPNFSIPLGGKYLHGQSVFLLVPPMANGPILQVLTNQTKFTLQTKTTQYSLIQYRFAARFKETININIGFGYDFPVPCFNIPINPITGTSPSVNFSSPEIAHENWLLAITRLRELVSSYAQTHKITLAEAKRLIPQATLPTLFEGLSTIAITAWLYPEQDGTSSLRSTSIPTEIEKYPLFRVSDSCALWIPITTSFPTSNDMVKHSGQAMSYVELFPLGDPLAPATIVQLPVDYSLEVGYPHAVKNALIIPEERLGGQDQNGNNSSMVSYSIALIVAIIVVIV